MKDKLTLEELKAQNAVEIEESKTDEVDVKTEVNKDEYVEDTKVDTEADANVDGDEDETKDKAEVESWQQSEEATHEDDHKSGFVPNHEAAKRRKQAQALKGELNDAKSENEELLARIAKLENGELQTKQAPTENVISEPKLPEDMYDEDAMRQYHQDMINYTKNVGNQYKVDIEKSTQQKALEEQKKSIAKNLDDHYERAAKLVADGRVTEESYKNADRMVRMSLDQIKPGSGDALTDAVISTLNSLGAGSEKVMYQLGVNSSKMQELKEKLKQDPSGNLASAFLGQLQIQVQSPKKRSSQAPAPGKAVDGEGGSGGPAGALQKAYAKSNDPNERVDMKRKAKKAGHDVSNW